MQHFSVEPDDAHSTTLENPTTQIEDPEGPFEHRKFRPKSTFNPPGPLTLEAFALANEQDHNRRPLTPLNKWDNLTKGERKAMEELKRNPDIVIKPADKGSAVVVMDLDMYLAEGMKQLQDRTTYLPLNHDPTEDFRCEVQRKLDAMLQNGEIGPKTREFLFDEKCRTSRLYLLPKIHKGKIPPPCRPVVSANEVIGKDITVGGSLSEPAHDNTQVVC